MKILLEPQDFVQLVLIIPTKAVKLGTSFVFSESSEEEGKRGGKPLYYMLSFHPEIAKGSTSGSSRYRDHL